jgi:hypothetical protein
MIGIAIRFPAGRFHATPWGRWGTRVAASPWRISARSCHGSVHSDPSCPAAAGIAARNSSAPEFVCLLPPPPYAQLRTVVQRAQGPYACLRCLLPSTRNRTTDTVARRNSDSAEHAALVRIIESSLSGRSESGGRVWSADKPRGQDPHHCTLGMMLQTSATEGVAFC